MRIVIGIFLAVAILSFVGGVIYSIAAGLYLLTLGFGEGLSWAEMSKVIPKPLRRFGFICGFTCVCSFLGSFTVAEVAYRRSNPAGLDIHIQSIPWESVTVESSNLPEARHFASSAHELLVSPIGHGEYRIGIRLQDGHTVWSVYLHADAGVRRRVDLFVAPSTRPGYIHFRQTANRNDELFTGEIRPEDTTEEKPFPLAGI